MENKIWPKIKWMWSSYLEMKKKAYPLAGLGTRLILAAISIVSVFNFVVQIMLPEDYFIEQIDFTTNELSIYSIVIGLVALVVGVYLIFCDLGNLARNTARVIITGMKGTTGRFPSELLAKSEKRDARETVELSIPESDDINIEKQISMYNSELDVNLYSRFILHNECSRVYLGGIARIPFLVAYGACFRAVSSKIIYFDKFHKGGEWRLLNDEDENIEFEEFNVDSLIPNQYGDIGVAVSFSNKIEKFHLPEKIRENTIIVTPNCVVGKNLIKNQDNLHAISETFKLLIDDLSNKQGCKKIHLFLSVQSTMALEIGRMFQEGTHKNWVIHNFNASEGKYEWAIELSKKGISKYLIQTKCDEKAA